MIVQAYHLKSYIYQDDICWNFENNEFFQMKSKKFLNLHTNNRYLFFLFIIPISFSYTRMGHEQKSNDCNLLS